VGDMLFLLVLVKQSFGRKPEMNERKKLSQKIFFTQITKVINLKSET